MKRNADCLSAQNRLIHEAQACRCCPRMGRSRRVLSDRNGPWNASIMFVAEAPGRFGAERTGIPLCGDRSGERFETLLSVMGLERRQVFVTNAVLCNPRDGEGHNSAPTQKELANCSDFLARTIGLVNPLIVIALGRVALEALALVCGHDLRLREAAGRLAPWHGRMLGVLYHPSPRTIVHRPWLEQLGDARALARAAECLLTKP